MEENPFKAGDKVVTHLKGMEVQGSVRSIWNHEVQIRIAGGELIWRTMKKVKLAERVAPVVLGAASAAESSAGPVQEPRAADVVVGGGEVATDTDAPSVPPPHSEGGSEHEPSQDALRGGHDITTAPAAAEPTKGKRRRRSGKRR